MTQSNSLPSALKVAAEVDAALAQAGLAGPQVEREAIPMYLAMLHELIDCPETHPHLPDLKKSNAAELVAVWMRAEQLTPDHVVEILTEQVDEVIELSAVHGTLQDFKRRELFNLHRKIVAFIQLPSTLTATAYTQSL